jgi:hypothetical protein
VSISAGDSSNTFVQGTPQVFTVTLTVLPPCALQMGATTGLSFTKYFLQRSRQLRWSFFLVCSRQCRG